MRKHLIIAAFEKARIESKENGTDTEAKTKLATVLSDYILENLKHPINERSLRDYYSKAMAIDVDKDIKIAQQNVIKGLCQYLGYDSYQAFLGNSKTPNTNLELAANPLQKHKPFSFLKKYKTALLSVIVTIILVTYIIKINQQCWMIWNGETYEETAYEAELLQNGSLKLCNQDRLAHFRQLKNINCDTEFFNADGSAKVWYAKNKNGTLDCFTSYGLHPETGKTLKPITVYMIEKYFNCTNY